ncbi:MAG TPA: bifunctional 3-deoxy-7-phosphoheptulonate synthase/chorismate mutase type II [Bacteroidales bacterium]|nr:bifunctional 3-deoxy-7-phosphoheptulonate synthase/chorismate mutase type II [Bacteroidales bacterium]HRS18613.1 bifunctional 3-deoxy-7-phosphoheptulonate synthase/chorismate mutase type II [Bacteroidales bacterium]
MHLNIEPIESWGVKPTKPFILSGPCSAESEEQVLTAARGLAAYGVQIFRAGIWKPRTRPNQFEGVGSVGLKWLRTVKQETGMLTATEVANVKHVYEALKMGVDILWIGARTSANPFSVQEIADALQGVDIPVLIKNPVNPDLELWIGAIERIAGAGITKLGAIHRGFSSSEKTKYRNVPQWQVAIELHQRIPNLPIICDPSHIAGRADLVFEISQQAMDLGQDGLIIESHPNPKIALSDGKQQLTPDEVGQLIKNLKIREATTDNIKFTQSLEELRAKIDMIDEEILAIIQRRMNVVKEIGKNKKENNIRILQTDRWMQIIEKAKQKGNSKGLSDEFIEKLFKAIHQESINIQTEILNS